MPTRFERDTAVDRVDDCNFEARLDRAWWVVRGPNGGYLAAIVLRALSQAVGDPTRAPRSLSLHYTSPPEEGSVTVVTALERVGRSLTTCSARMYQGDRLAVLALAAFSPARPGPEFSDGSPPDVPDPEAAARWAITETAPPVAHRWDGRAVFGRPPVPEAPLLGEAVAGGWMRLEEPQLLDASAVAAMTDGWIPAVFSRLDEPIVVPTVDLTVHFRRGLPLADATPDDFLLAEFRTKVSTEGFLEEDGMIWSRDGRLVAQSRQLAVAMPVSP